MTESFRFGPRLPTSIHRSLPAVSPLATSHEPMALPKLRSLSRNVLDHQIMETTKSHYRINGVRQISQDHDDGTLSERDDDN